MKTFFITQAGFIHSLDDVLEGLVVFLKNYRHNRANCPIAFVTGPITSNGSSHIARNTTRLIDNTRSLQAQTDGLVFCWFDIFCEEVKQAVRYESISYEGFLTFSKQVVASGYITDIYMTPNFESSTGARLEHETAQACGLRIHYL